MKHSKLVAVLVVSVMICMMVQPAFAGGTLGDVVNAGGTYALMGAVGGALLFFTGGAALLVPAMIEGAALCGSIGAVRGAVMGKEALDTKKFQEDFNNFSDGLDKARKGLEMMSPQYPR